MIGLLTSAVLIASTGEEVDAAPKIDEEHEIVDLAKPAAPFKAARVYWSGESVTLPTNECQLAIKTDHGWTVAQFDSDCWGNGHYYRRLEPKEFVVKGGLLWLHYTEESSDPDEGGTSHGEYLVICGMAEDVPRCTARIEIGYTFDTTPKWKVDASLSKGTLALSLAKGKKSALPDETKALLGKSTLRFDK